MWCVDTHLNRFAADRRCADNACSLISTVRRVYKVVLQLFSTHVNGHLLEKPEHLVSTDS